MVCGGAGGRGSVVCWSNWGEEGGLMAINDSCEAGAFLRGVAGACDRLLGAGRCFRHLTDLLSPPPARS
jgi:hypothetical protein